MSLVVPALVSADFARLGEALEMAADAGARIIHVDVADGHFVPDLTMGQPVIASLRRATKLELDVHLLIERPERYVTEFVSAGANRICLHPQATSHFYHALELIRKRGAKAGAALDAGTPIESLLDVLSGLDFLNILCADLAADGGLREQSFLPASVRKIRTAAEFRDSHRLDFAIEVEGSVGPRNLGALIDAGADILVAGSAIFQEGSPKSQLSDMIRLAAEAPGRRTV
jgi:ribulose-phosphate 3-epimerase